MTTFHSKTVFHATRSTVYQLRAEVSHPDGMEIAFSHLTELILQFAAKSLYAKLPPEAGELRSFEFQNDKRSCECISVPERMLWAIRLKFPSEHLAGRLILHPRAERAVAKAEYSDVKAVYRTLLILANEYRDSRMGVGTDEAFRKALADNGMDFSGSIDKCRAGQEGEADYVKYPVGTAKRAFLRYHILKGTAHEDRFCMRIYFFWDDETGQVVVGWLPSHLSNRCS